MAGVLAAGTVVCPGDPIGAIVRAARTQFRTLCAEHVVAQNVDVPAARTGRSAARAALHAAPSNASLRSSQASVQSGPGTYVADGVVLASRCGRLAVAEDDAQPVRPPAGCCRPTRLAALSALSCRRAPSGHVCTPTPQSERRRAVSHLALRRGHATPLLCLGWVHPRVWPSPPLQPHFHDPDEPRRVRPRPPWRATRRRRLCRASATSRRRA